MASRWARSLLSRAFVATTTIVVLVRPNGGCSITSSGMAPAMTVRSSSTISPKEFTAARAPTVRPSWIRWAVPIPPSAVCAAIIAPVPSTAFTSCTSMPGRSRSVSRVPGAPPRTSPDPTVPGGQSTTVHPVRPTGSVQWPTRIPSTAVITRPAPGAVGQDAPSHRPPVLPRDPMAHSAHHLVPDGSVPRGHLVGGDLLIVLPAEEDHLVPHLDVVVAAIHRGLIHGHGSGDRVSLSSDEDPSTIEEGSRVPVRVPDRHGGDGGIPIEAVREAVRDALARGHPLRQGDLRTERHGRFQGHPPDELRVRPDPVQSDAHANEVEMGLGQSDGGS